MQLLQIITQRFGGTTQRSETLTNSIVQILPDPPLFGLANIYDLALQALGMFQKRDALGGNIDFGAQGGASPCYDQIKSEVPEDLPRVNPTMEIGVTSEPVGAPPNHA